MIQYLGNKNKLSSFIEPYIPKDIETYIEPFGGSMGLFFSLKIEKYPNTEFIYNDKNKFNSDLFKCLKNEDFRNIVLDTTLNEKVYQESFDSLKSIDLYKRSLSWLIILLSGDVYDTLSKNYQGDYEFNNFKFKLPLYLNHLDRLSVYNLDYVSIIDIYDDITSFFYFDPPYYSFEKYYTYHDFDIKSHEKLSNILKEMKSKWVLSYYDFPMMKDYYSDYKIVNKKYNNTYEYLVLNTPGSQ